MNPTRRPPLNRRSVHGGQPGMPPPRTTGPEIDLGMGRRRVTGSDLNFFQALVSGNDQTLQDLTELRPDPDAPLVNRAFKERPAFVTEGWLDRFSLWMTGWITGSGRVAGRWLFRKRTGAFAVRMQGAWRDLRDSVHPAPHSTAVPRPEHPKRAA